MIKDLFDLAVRNLKKDTAKGKGFELYTLWSILKKMQGHGFQVKAQNVKAGALNFAGGPASADKKKFSYFLLQKRGERNQEAWISVQVSGISGYLSGKPKAKAARHEIDVATFYELTSSTPSYEDLTFAATCKHTPFHKAHLREALGLRRETAYYQRPAGPSRSDWFITTVPANPPVPLVLYSTDVKCLSYEKPVDELGVYVLNLALPIV